MFQLFVRLALIVGLGLAVAYCNEVSAKHYLQHRYASVQDIHYQFIQFSCYRTKDRMKFNFDATRPNGSKVSGYLCYDGPFDMWPVVHESN